MNKVYDYIIVGTGAGGSAAAYHLAQTGKQILLLEKGRALPRDGSTLDVNKVFRQGIFKNHESWQDGHGHTVVPQEYFNLGGKTKWYGAALLRFSPEEFMADQKHHCLGWPINYSELEPYYTEAEQLLGVRFFDIEPQLKAIISSLEKNGSGWRAQPLPLGLVPTIVEEQVEAKHFDGFASVKNLKFDAELALLDRIKEQSNVSILTGKEVIELCPVSNSPQQIANVRCKDGSNYSGHVFILAAGAMHSPRILQRYFEETGFSHQSPSYRWVGSNYKCHLNTAMLAISGSRKTDVLRKTVLLLNDAFKHSSVQTLGWMDGEIVGAQLPNFVPAFVADLIGERAYGFWLTTEDGSSEANRITASSNGSKSPRLDYDPGRLQASIKEHKQLIKSFRWELLKTGFISFAKQMPVDATAHACGTLVTGSSPQNSVVDTKGKAHDLENLYVVDGSVLPRSSKVNPSLTIYAWALRVSDLLSKQNAARKNKVTSNREVMV